MKMQIFLLDSYFGEVQDRSKDHLDRMSRTCILNLFHMCKVNLIYPTCIRDLSHRQRCLYIGETWSSLYTHFFFLGIFFSLGWRWSNILGSAFRASWWSILDETSWGCVTHVGGWPYEDFVGWSVLLIVVMPPLFISVFGLSSIDLLVCSICILLSLYPRSLKYICI